MTRAFEFQAARALTISSNDVAKNPGTRKARPAEGEARREEADGLPRLPVQRKLRPSRKKRIRLSGWTPPDHAERVDLPDQGHGGAKKSRVVEAVPG